LPREGTSDREIFERVTALGVETVWRLLPSRAPQKRRHGASKGGDRGVRGKIVGSAREQKKLSMTIKSS